jgi:Xaa-Pro aminopeptidase
MAGLRVPAGPSEMEIACRINAWLKRLGARPAFRIIVASGKRSAIPHGYATQRNIRQGDLVVIDFGALYNGYRSDITRTFIAGKASPRQKKIYQIVREAQKKAIKAVRPGGVCREVDRAARSYIEKQGFGKYFIHNTGHGIGKRVHQAPKISRKNARRLKAGMVITIEPGIYIKGWGGVRIEDMVLVTKRSCRILTRAKK